MDATDELDRRPAVVAREVQLDVLRETAQVRDAQDGHAIVLPQVGKDSAVVGMDELEGAAAEDRMGAAHADEPLHPVQQRAGNALL